jgi:predicted SAM-dependent methyltransferase
LVAARRVRLNVGCGSLPLDDWINIDLIGLPIDLAWDLSRPLPFEDGTVDAIFHEHVIEHLPGAAGYRLLKECHRLLRPDGVLRVVAPDASKYIESYFDPQHEFIRSFRGDRPTPMLALQEEFYGFGHRAVYDHDTIALFCDTIGFSHVERSAFGRSRIDPCPDSEWRVTDSFYSEAVK